jgi:hypothetical protein
MLMFRDVRLLVFRLAVLTALAGSALELSRPLLSGGCGACAPKWALVVGGLVVPLPWLGLGGSSLLLVLSFRPGRLAPRLRTGLSLVGGGLALGLLLLQAGLPGSLCLTCALVDGALVLAALVEATRTTAPDAFHKPRVPAAQAR